MHFKSSFFLVGLRIELRFVHADRECVAYFGPILNAGEPENTLN